MGNGFAGYRRTYKDFTIAAGETQPASPLDSGVTGVLCGIRVAESSLGSVTSMTFDDSDGKASSRSNEPLPPTQASDYNDLKDQDGSQLITVTLTGAKKQVFDGPTAAKAANMSRWLLPTLNAVAPAGGLTFRAYFRVY